MNLDQIQSQALPDFNFRGGTIGDVVGALLPYIFAAAGILLLLYLLWGGLRLMVSGGDQKAIQEAKGNITTALIGFLIVFVAYWLVQIVGRFLGLEEFIDIFSRGRSGPPPD